MATLTKTGATGFSGDAYRYVIVSGKMITPFPTATFRLRYDIGGGFSDSVRAMDAVNISTKFRGVILNTLKAGDKFIAIFDAADSTNYASEWQGQTITGLELQVGGAAENGSVLISSIIPCSLNLLASQGGECFNTRSTCVDVNNYRVRPDNHLTPTVAGSDNDTLLAASFTTNDNGFIAVDVSIDNSPSGTIAAAGSSTNYFYLGFTGSNLIFSAGGDADSNRGRAVVASSIVEGKSLTLVGEIDNTGDTVNLWSFDSTTKELTLLASDEADTALPGNWMAATDGQIGGDGGNTYGAEDGGDFSGLIKSFRYHSQLFDSADDTTFKRELYFGKKVQQVLLDDVKVFPMLMNISTVGSRINLAASDQNYDPLGGRAVMEATLEDAVATDRGVDPYFTDRKVDETDEDASMFWERNRVRQKFGKVSALATVFEGYANEGLAQMKKRLYLLDQIDLPQGESVRMRARDILSRAELSKTQVPPASNGVLVADVDDNAATLTFDTQGHEFDEYPQTGTVVINSECITYTAIVDNGDETFTWTLAARATDGTEIDAHEAGDTVQICRRYTLARVDDVLTELMGKDAEIEYQYLALSNWTSETDAYLSAYTLDTLLTEPQGVNQLVGEIAEQCSFHMWWDERAQLLDLQALRALNALPAILTDEANFIAGSVSLREKPRERVTQVWFFYNQLDPTEPLDDVQNYKNTYVDVNLQAESEDQYNERAIRRIFSRWLPTEAQVTQTASRIRVRYADIPVELKWQADAKDRDLWVGDIREIQTYKLRDAFGERQTGRYFIITSAKETVAGEIVEYIAEDTTLGGFIYRITSNGQGDRTGDPAIDDLYAFITDNDGLYPDGTEGTRIQ